MASGGEAALGHSENCILAKKQESLEENNTREGQENSKGISKVGMPSQSARIIVETVIFFFF